jgi:hypothetical protein
MTDPRFDPAFQRGYEGPNPELVVRRQAASEVVPLEVTASSGPDAAPEPRSLDPVSASGAGVSEPEPRAGPRNPYRLGLLLGGILLIVAAAAILSSQVQQPQASDTTPQAQFVHLLLGLLPPSLLLSGLVCIILWLAIGALDRLDPVPPSEPEPVSLPEPEPRRSDPAPGTGADG